MILFECDYNEGAHQRVLELLQETNLEQTPGYGEDHYCRKAAAMIRDLCQCPQADVYFLVGGTQVNLTAIAAALRPHQGAIAATSGHINVHESGAVEATGHKVLPLASSDGKITADQVLQLWKEHFDDPTRIHMVQPKLVYISNPTELGTLYSRRELQDLHQLCREKDLYLYLDGARLGYGLCASGNDLDLPEIARCCDGFYIGGTKQGALFGEALVLVNPELKRDFPYLIKQRGGLLAKGRLLGLQFMALLEGGDQSLYFQLSRHADAMADKLRQAFAAQGCDFLVPTTANQLFPILPDAVLDRLKDRYGWSPWQRVDGGQAVRFCSSWATREKDVDQFIADLGRAFQV